jgi:hypothetical protein
MRNIFCDLSKLSESARQAAEKNSYASLRSIASLQRTSMYASARRFFARLASEIFLSGLQSVLIRLDPRFRGHDGEDGADPVCELLRQDSVVNGRN